MGFSIDEMKARIKGGVSHPNLFRVYMNFPTSIGSSIDTDSGTFMIKATSEPASRVGTIPLNGPGGGILKVAGDREFDQWTVTVLNDRNQSLRNIFQKWVNLQKKSGENTGGTNFDYMVSSTLERLDRSGSVTKTYTLYNLFPVEVGSIDLSFDTRDSVEEFTVNLEYSHFI